MSITVYSKKPCTQCDATYRALDRKGLDYTSVDFMKDPQATEFVMNSGFNSAPVVVVEHEDGNRDVWGGFDLEKINSLAIT